MELPHELVELAKTLRRHAHAPYSHYPVGAALLDAHGHLHGGCNVENASYGLTVCAERVAVGNAIAAGAREFRALAVVSSGAAPPCGACRQVLAEFCAGLPIWLIDADDPTRAIETSLGALLPQRFKFHGHPS
jgi:cytidine deaminase